MKSLEIRAAISDKLGIKTAVRSIGSRPSYIEARIRPNKGARIMDPLTWPCNFPVEFTNLCIRVVYPNNPKLHTQSAAGNIGAHSIAISPREWELVFAAWAARS